MDNTMVKEESEQDLIIEDLTYQKSKFDKEGLLLKDLMNFIKRDVHDMNVYNDSEMMAKFGIEPMPDITLLDEDHIKALGLRYNICKTVYQKRIVQLIKYYESQEQNFIAKRKKNVEENLAQVENEIRLQSEEEEPEEIKEEIKEEVKEEPVVVTPKKTPAKKTKAKKEEISEETPPPKTTRAKSNSKTSKKK